MVGDAWVVEAAAAANTVVVVVVAAGWRMGVLGTHALGPATSPRRHSLRRVPVTLSWPCEAAKACGPATRQGLAASPSRHRAWATCPAGRTASPT